MSSSLQQAALTLRNHTGFVLGSSTIGLAPEPSSYTCTVVSSSSLRFIQAHVRKDIISLVYCFSTMIEYTRSKSMATEDSTIREQDHED